MSSYLSIYLVPKRKNKKEGKQYLLLSSYSRSSDLYEVFNENIPIAFCGNKEKYTTLTKVDMQKVLDELTKCITFTKERLQLYEKYASNNPDYIQSILDDREVLKDYEYTYGDASFIKGIVDDTVDNYNSFEEVCCNIS